MARDVGDLRSYEEDKLMSGLLDAACGRYDAALRHYEDARDASLRSGDRQMSWDASVLGASVLARAGQKVNPRDVVADAILAPEHLIFDIVRALRIPAKNVEKYLQRKPGETIREGDVIAQGPRGFTQRIVRAPCDGKIAAIEQGKVILQRDQAPFELIAGYTGSVVSLIEGYGVIIEAVGALIQGVWGNERVDSGLMRTLAAQPNSVLTPKDLNVNTRGAFILSGHVEDPETLKVAMDVPIRGLILASMPPTLVDLARKMPYPILLTEGFGNLPMNSSSFLLLSSYQERDV
jgi:hypothetical protein